jgi:hypothetical protein
LRAGLTGPKIQLGCAALAVLSQKIFMSLKRARYLTPLQAGGADLHTLDRILKPSSHCLEVGQPTPLVVRVPVRPQERIVTSDHWSFSAYITTLRHNKPSQLLSYRTWVLTTLKRTFHRLGLLRFPWKFAAIARGFLMSDKQERTPLYTPAAPKAVRRGRFR